MSEEEFEAFFRLVHPKLVRFAMRRFDSATAEDLAARALQTFWDRRPELPAEGVESQQLQHFAYALLGGLMRNEHRSRQSRRRALGRLAAERQRHSPDPAEVALGAKWPEWASRLPLTDRDLLELVAEDYPAAEIAVILGCSVPAVHQRLSRARKRALRLMRRGVQGR